MNLPSLFANRKYILTGFILVALLVGIVFIQKRGGTNVIGTAIDQSKAKGPITAKLQLVEFSDFQCPACKRAQPVLNALAQNYEGKLRIVYRHFPLQGHAFAKPAHQAAECAARQGKFWQYHDKLYDQQEVWSALKDPMQRFVEYAVETGLQLNQFGDCMADQKVTDEIFAEKADGERLKIASTPTFFINGERFVGSVELASKGEAYIRETLGMEPKAPAPQEPAATA